MALLHKDALGHAVRLARKLLLIEQRILLMLRGWRSDSVLLWDFLLGQRLLGIDLWSNYGFDLGLLLICLLLGTSVILRLVVINLFSNNVGLLLLLLSLLFLCLLDHPLELLLLR